MKLSNKTIVAILGAALASQGAALKIGAWVGSANDTSKKSDTAQDVSSPQPTQANVAAFVILQGRPVDYVEYYSIWPEAWSVSAGYADIAANNGATLFVTWQPNGYSAPDIVSGKADTYINKFAADIKSYKHEVWLRPLHEANGNWYSWAVGTSNKLNTDANVSVAFQHIVTIFKNAGVTNVKWVWTTNSENITSGNQTTFTGNYPGDAYVDYVSIDGYNKGKFHPNYVGDYSSSWQTFAQVFSPAYKAMANINKPVFIAEFSSSEKGGDKAQWYKDAFASLAGTFPKVVAMMVFSMNDANGDWRINTTNTSLQAWKDCVAKYATTSLAPQNSRTKAFVYVQGSNRIELDLDHSERVRVSVRDGLGNLLANNDLGVLNAGSHGLDLGIGHGLRLVQVQAGDRRETLSLAGL